MQQLKLYDVTVISSKENYSDLMLELNKNNGSTSEELEKITQQFYETTYYDSLISDYLSRSSNTLFPKKKLFMLI